MKPKPRPTLFIMRNRSEAPLTATMSPFTIIWPAPPGPAHHVSAKNDFRSVYFMRCEESAEQILIGNLQIDDTMPQYWDDPVVGQIMLQTKNMTSMMVQHALRHALRTGKKDILFQCGDANDLTQWGRQSLREVRVTRRNYKKFMEGL